MSKPLTACKWSFYFRPPTTLQLEKYQLWRDGKIPFSTLGVYVKDRVEGWMELERLRKEMERPKMMTLQKARGRSERQSFLKEVK